MNCQTPIQLSTTKFCPPKVLQMRMDNVELDEDRMYVSVSPYQNASLTALHAKLNAAKSSMDIIYLRDSEEFNAIWKKFQSLLDTYNMLKPHITREYGATGVTNGWLKQWELQSNFAPIPKHQSINAFFNADSSGSASAALIHYMATARPDVNFSWWACANTDLTQYTRSSVVNDNPQNWVTTPTNNGDMTNIDCILDIVDKFGPGSITGGMDFYSHDAGLNVSDNFNQQEVKNSKLLLGCAITGLLLLRPGGSFIAKQYTMFESLTWNLIMIYAHCFTSFTICKPLTSKPYNSEVYLIGRGFKGISTQLRQLLIAKLVNFDMTPMMEKSSLQIVPLVHFADAVFGQQIRFIYDNMFLWKAYNQDSENLYRRIMLYKKACMADWIYIHPIGRLGIGKQVQVIARLPSPTCGQQKEWYPNVKAQKAQSHVDMLQTYKYNPSAQPLLQF